MAAHACRGNYLDMAMDGRRIIINNTNTDLDLFAESGRLGYPSGISGVGRFSFSLICCSALQFLFL